MNPRSTLCLALLVLAACCTPGGADAAGLPPEYFPAGASAPADLPGWRQLAAEHPLLVRVGNPDTSAAPGGNAPGPVALDSRSVYLRVLDLERDLPAVEAALATPRLVLDLRFTVSGPPEARRLGQLLARSTLDLPSPVRGAGPIILEPAATRAPEQLTVVLVNGGTRGPVEAVLAALQMRGDALLTGTATAGDTGWFETPAGMAGVQVISGEFRPAPSVSILGRGVQPALEVEVSAADDRAAYAAFFEDTALPELLDPTVDKSRFDEAALLERHGRTRAPRRATQGTAADDKSAEVAPPAIDRILQRGVNAVVAFDVLRSGP